MASAANGPGTLMQWGYGPEVRGGPDLNEPLVTDRPDFTESSVTVGMGVVQIESGYTFTYDDHEDGKVSEHSYPETLFRVGMLAEWFELRLGWNYGDSAETVFGGSDQNLSGAEDLYVGSKFALTPQSDCLPETGLILQMTVPTGSACTIGLKDTRPSRRAVGSPSWFAVHACAHSCTVNENSRTMKMMKTCAKLMSSKQ